MLEYGGLDILVASAGLATSAPITETTLADWERNYAVLARGYFLAARETFRVLLEQGRGGSVVFVASKNALVAGANAAAYSSAKAASLHLARCLAEEGGPHGIRVNTVNPDAVIQGSSIWSSDWKAERASTYGVERGRPADVLPRPHEARGQRLPGGRRRGDRVLRRPALDEVHRKRPQRRRRRHRRVSPVVRRRRTMHRFVSSLPTRKEASMHKRRWAVVASPRSSSQASRSRPRWRRRATPTAGKTFYFIPKDTLNPYEVIADHGGKLALTELGDKQVVSSGTEDTAAAQQPAIQAAIQAHAAGIVIAGNDPQAVCPALKQAQAQGTKVVAFDSDVNCRQLFINQADTETIGRSQIQLLGEADGLQGPVRDPVRGLDGDEPERLDQVHEARAEEAGVQEHEAREDLLRQRQPGPVAAGDGEHAAGVPEPEGDRVADDGRHLVGRAVPLDLEVQEARSCSRASACRAR